jgi:hypothetical protein
MVALPHYILEFVLRAIWIVGWSQLEHCLFGFLSALWRALLISQQEAGIA